MPSQDAAQLVKLAQAATSSAHTFTIRTIAESRDLQGLEERHVLEITKVGMNCHVVSLTDPSNPSESLSYEGREFVRASAAGAWEEILPVTEGQGVVREEDDVTVIEAPLGRYEIAGETPPECAGVPLDTTARATIIREDSTTYTLFLEAHRDRTGPPAVLPPGFPPTPDRREWSAELVIAKDGLFIIRAVIETSLLRDGQPLVSQTLTQTFSNFGSPLSIPDPTL